MTAYLTPLIFNLGPTELIIILVIVLLLFGGSRLAGLGKSSGRALKEFKEETRGLRDGDKANDPSATSAAPQTYPPQQVTNGQPVTGQSATGQPVNGQPTYPPMPSNLSDPSATDVRKDA